MATLCTENQPNDVNQRHTGSNRNKFAKVSWHGIFSFTFVRVRNIICVHRLKSTTSQLCSQILSSSGQKELTTPAAAAEISGGRCPRILDPSMPRASYLTLWCLNPSGCPRSSFPAVPLFPRSVSLAGRDSIPCLLAPVNSSRNVVLLVSSRY